MRPGRNVSARRRAIPRPSSSPSRAVVRLWRAYEEGFQGFSRRHRAPSGMESSTEAPIEEALAVDAACSGNPGVMEYRGVYLPSRRVIFEMGPFPKGTNNIGEFLAIVHALALIEKQGSRSSSSTPIARRPSDGYARSAVRPFWSARPRRLSSSTSSSVLSAGSRRIPTRHPYISGIPSAGVRSPLTTVARAKPPYFFRHYLYLCRRSPWTLRPWAFGLPLYNTKRSAPMMRMNSSSIPLFVRALSLIGAPTSTCRCPASYASYP